MLKPGAPVTSVESGHHDDTPRNLAATAVCGRDRFGLAPRDWGPGVTSTRPDPGVAVQGRRVQLRTTRRILRVPSRRRQYWSGVVRVVDDEATLALSGELDLECEVGLTALLVRMEAWPDTLVVDLAAVTFADSHGLQVLFDSARRRRDARLPALLLSDPGPFLAQLLCLLGAQRVVDTEHHEHLERSCAPTTWYAC